MIRTKEAKTPIKITAKVKTIRLLFNITTPPTRFRINFADVIAFSTSKREKNYKNELAVLVLVAMFTKLLWLVTRLRCEL